MIEVNNPKLIDNKKLWNYIESNIKAKNLDDKYLIQLFNITPRTLSHWKNGTRDISQDKLVILSFILGISIDGLLDYAKEEI